MKKLLLVLMLLIAVAISGCTEKSPSGTSSSGAEKSVGELKTLTVKSAEDLKSYSLKSSASYRLNGVGINDTPDNATTIIESTETIGSMNLSGLKASYSSSTKDELMHPDKTTNSSTTEINRYLIGNSTYFKDANSKWTHLKDPRTAEEIWGQGNNNRVKALADMINNSQAEIIGSESIEGADAYKLRIITGSAELGSLYNTAFEIAAMFTPYYPMLMPSINTTELNKTGVVENTIWISKQTYLPVKYQNRMSFSMTPEIIAGLDRSTGQMKMFNQSVRLGKVSAIIETSDLYYDFNKPVEITLPAEALQAPAVSPTPAMTSAS